MLVPFLVIALLMGVGNLLGLSAMREVRDHVDLIVDNAMLSLELIHRLDSNLRLRRRLVLEYLMAPTPLGLSALKESLSENAGDYAATAKRYELLTTFPGEREAWQRLQEDVANSKQPVAEVLALSLSNRDGAARQFLERADPSFAAIDRDVAELTQINVKAAADSRQRIDTLDRTERNRLAFIGTVVVVLSLLISLLTTLAIRARERAEKRYAALLRERAQERDAFAGRVAHDLRGPLATITMAGGVLKHRLPIEDHAVATILRATSQMDALIHDLLALSRIDVEALYGHCDPALVAHQVHDSLAPHLVHEGGKLHVNVQPGRVQCGEGFLRQVLLNLVENAIKYRRPEVGSEIDVAGRFVGPLYELRVSDNGIGMSEDDLRHAFEPFFRAKRATTQPGTGLGLSIVKRVVEAYGGTVTAESTLGRGTTVIVRLVQANVEPPRHREPPG